MVSALLASRTSAGFGRVFCPKCRGILQAEDPWKRDEDTLKTHHENWPSFCNAIDSKCALCTDLWKRIERNCHPDCTAPNRERQSKFRMYWSLRNEPGSKSLPYLGFEFRCFCKRHSKPLGPWTYEVLKLSTSIAIKGHLSGYAGTNGSLGEAAPRSYVANDSWTGAETVMNLIRTWVENCAPMTLLETVRQPSSSWPLPTRLIDVTGDKHVRLVADTWNLAPVKYIALSYCWGKSQRYVLSTSTMSRAQEQIACEELSQTAQDAITVTRRLGLRYLWIDALCIIQDDVDDWSRESLKMADVYGKAWCTIAAAASDASSGGLFREREIQHAQPIIAPCAWKTPGWSGLTGEILLVDASKWQEEVEMSPLSSRAWAFQERLLSQRVIFFGEHQVSWECSHTHASEVFPEGLVDFNGNDFEMGGSAMSATLNPRFGSVYTYLPRQLRHITDQGFVSSWDFDQLLKTWRNLLPWYTGCDLTASDDRLIAISGIIETIERATGRKNIAGMWKDNLVEELYWRRIGNLPTDMVPNPPYLFTAKPSRHWAPSWSWVSVNGQVQHITPPSDSRAQRSHEHTASLVTILDASVENPSQSDLATTQAGHIRLTCWLHEANLQSENMRDPYNQIDLGVTCACRELNARISADDVLTEDTLLGTTLFLMPLLTYIENTTYDANKNMLGGLVLTRTQHQREHKRFGRFECERPGGSHGPQRFEKNCGMITKRDKQSVVTII